MARNVVAILCLVLAGGPAAADEPAAPLDVSADVGRVLEKCEPPLDKLARTRRKMEQVRATAAKPLDETGLAIVAVRLRDVAGDLDKARDEFRAAVVELRICALKCALTGRHDSHATRFTDLADELQRYLGDRGPKASPLTRAMESVAGLSDAFEKRGTANAASITDAEALLLDTRRSAHAIVDAFASAEASERVLLLAREIRTRQAKIGADLSNLRRDYVPPALGKDPVIGPAQPVILSKKGTATVKHTLEWNLYEKDELEVKVTASDPALTVPAALKLDFEKHQFRFEYEVKAGNVAGAFTVTLTPAAGKPVTVQVTVE